MTIGVAPRHSSVAPTAETKLWLIAIAASPGGLQALMPILTMLPRELPAAVVVVLHRTSQPDDVLATVLGRCASMPVVLAVEGQTIDPGTVYLARPDRHLGVSSGRRFTYSNGRRIKFVRSSANPLLEFAAAAFGGYLIAVVLSGLGSDATDGVQTVKAHGGYVIAQDRATSQFWGMPEAAIETGAVDLVLPIDAIGSAVAALIEGRLVVNRMKARAEL